MIDGAERIFKFIGDKILDIREFVGGALNNHRFYLRLIALPNCKEFIDFYESNFRKCYPANNEVDKYVFIRKFLAAVESLNNIFDYLYHEFHQGVGTIVPSKVFKIDVESFKLKALSIIGLDCVNEVVEMANAYKHSRRRKQIYKISNAKDLIERRRYGFNAGCLDLTPLDGGFYFPKESQVMALRDSTIFWSAYCRNRAHVSWQDLESLLR